MRLTGLFGKLFCAKLEKLIVSKKYNIHLENEDFL